MRPALVSKTVIFSEVLKSTYHKRKSAIMVVRGRKLVDQAHQRLIRECVPHGVLMSGHRHYMPKERIQICSIDTVISRKLYPTADLIVIDEAHLATSKSYLDFCEKYPDAFFLPVTATPYTKNSLHHCAKVIVHPISMKELIAADYLVPARYFAPYTPDLKKVKMDYKTGDFNQKDLGEAMNLKGLVGDIVSHWKKIGGGRPTIAFAVNVNHSKLIAEQFCEAGIKAEHCDADTPDERRMDILKRLGRGDISVISNVGLFGTGVDLPFLSCLILARPTKSYSLFIQQVGRGTRSYSGKRDFIVLDHAGNTLRHGKIEDEKEGWLEGRDIPEQKLQIKTCKKCFAVFLNYPCPECGFEKIEQERTPLPTVSDGELRELGIELPKINVESLTKKYLYELFHEAKLKKYKPGWIFYRLKAKFGSMITTDLMREHKQMIASLK